MVQVLTHERSWTLCAPGMRDSSKVKLYFICTLVLIIEQCTLVIFFFLLFATCEKNFSCQMHCRKHSNKTVWTGEIISMDISLIFFLCNLYCFNVIGGNFMFVFALNYFKKTRHFVVEILPFNQHLIFGQFHSKITLSFIASGNSLKWLLTCGGSDSVSLFYMPLIVSQKSLKIHEIWSSGHTDLWDGCKNKHPHRNVVTGFQKIFISVCILKCLTAIVVIYRKAVEKGENKIR